MRQDGATPENIPARLLNEVGSSAGRLCSMIDSPETIAAFGDLDIIGRTAIELIRSTGIVLERHGGKGWGIADYPPGSTLEVVRGLHRASVTLMAGFSVLKAEPEWGQQLLKHGSDAVISGYKQFQIIRR